MLKNLSYVRRQKLLLPLTGIVLLLCWWLAFSKTFDAWQLNRRLQTEAGADKDLSYNPAYQQRKFLALDSILKSYKARADWKDQLWINASATASNNGIAVNFTLDEPKDEGSDSTQVGEQQSLFFHGRFVQLVKVLDTLENMKGIGRVSCLKLKRPGRERETNGLGDTQMKIDFKIIN